MVLKFDLLQTVALAVCVYYFGQFIKGKVNTLQKYCIPSPVVGGVIFAVAALALRMSGVLIFEFDVTLQNVFMTMFFTSVGFTASFKVLKKGGVAVFTFLAIAGLLVTIQNIAGAGLATVFGLDPKIGLAMGSISMAGGHGTAGSFGPLLENTYGIQGANVVALASATFGLVAGSLIGGPIGKKLIEKNNLKPIEENQAADLERKSAHELLQPSILNAFAILFVSMGVGSFISNIIANWVTVPTYIGAMMVAVIIRNVSDAKGIAVPYKEIDILGSVGLALFLSMALMTLKLWELIELAAPMIVILLVQTVIMAIFAYFVTYKLMGKDYDAAVLSSGICGFGMGATPNAIANMDAITSKYGFSAKGYLVVPIVGGMFIDFVNTFILTIFLNVL